MTGPGQPVGGGTAATRLWGAASVVIGTATLLLPDQVARLVSGSGAAPHSTVVRILGGRQLLQGSVVSLRPAPVLMLGGIAVDVLHAASMIGAALRWSRYRRAALASAAVASTSAAVGTLILRRRR